MNDSKLKVPNLFVVGAAKSGTTALYNFLNQHRDIYMSPLKEPHFFCTDIRRENFSNFFKNRSVSPAHLKHYLSKKRLSKMQIAFVDNERDYFQLFSEHSDEKYLGEVSNGYLLSTVAAQNIYNYNPEAKIIMILRDPCDRAFSQWLREFQANLSRSSNFVDDVNYDYSLNDPVYHQSSYTLVEQGLYFNQVKRYLDLFPHNNIKILFHHDLKNSPEKVKNDLFSFLNVENYNINFKKKYNATKMPRNKLIAGIFNQIRPKNPFLRDLLPKKIKSFILNIIFSSDKKGMFLLSKKEKIEIFNHFKNDINHLEKLLNVKLDQWKID